MQIVQETAGHTAVVGDGVVAQGKGESPDMRLEDLVEIEGWTGS